MKKAVLLILTLCLCLSSVFSVSAAAPEIDSRAAILIDAKTGQILYAKNQDEVLYPASITKIMTIYLGVRDPEKLDKYFSASEEAIDAVPRDTSNIALDYGEEITLKDALYAAMLMSANDACNLVAEAASGSVEKFVELMNTTAKTFGARNTHFANANGLTDENHYTTAYDFAMITMNALKSDAFKKIFGSMEYTISPTNKNSESRNFVAQHRMMHQAKYSHLGVEGGKNGYTSASSYTLVTYGVKEDRELICVILKSPSFNSVYGDTEALLEYGYGNFRYESVSAKDVDAFVDGLTTYTPVGETSFLLENDIEKASLIKTYEGDRVQIKTPAGVVLGELETTSVTRMSLGAKIWRIVKIVFFVIVGIIIILYGLLIVSSNKSRKRRRKSR